MQNVSVQMTEALTRRDDIDINTIILHSSWKFIGIKSFFFLLTLFWRIPSNIKKHNPDVVLFSSMVTAGVLPLFLKMPAVPFVTINHGQDVTLPVSLYQWYVKYIFKKLNGVISVSSATRQASIQRGMNPEIGVTLPNGYDSRVQKKLPSKEEAIKILEQEFDYDLKGKKILLTVGRQVKRKGHEWFIDQVFPKVKSEAVYLIVGDGPEFDNIAGARNQSPKKEKIIITGKLTFDLLNACYSAADLFVMPNIQVEGDMEGFGIVLLEANQAGVPAIASDLEGIKDVIKQGVNGYRIPHGEAGMFAKKIDETLFNGLEELSQSAREYVLNTFSWDSVVERYIKFLKTLIAKSGSSV